jgi:hypothetical protein
MERLTYKQAYDKIIEAYFKDEIKPYDGFFCFCGTLGYTGSSDIFAEIWDLSLYSKDEYEEMEKALLLNIKNLTIGDKWRGNIYVMNDRYRDMIMDHENYEQALFSGMSAALDVLKQIHIERGENVDDVPVFTKRLLNQ